MKRLGRVLLPVILIFWSQGMFAQHDSIRISSSDSIIATLELNQLTVIDSIILFGKTYLGKPYRYRNASTPPLDCSGFVNHIFKAHNLSLPRSSREMALVVDKVELKDVRPGDLLFFKGRNRDSRTVGHVSLVTEVDGKRVKMMHSSNSMGIVIEYYPSAYYYNPRFLFAGRVKELDKVISADQKPITINFVESKDSTSSFVP